MGKDSLCMVLKLIELKYPLDEVLYYDSGVEFECMAVLAERLKALCEENGIKFTTVYPQKSFIWNMTERPVTKKDGTKQQGYKWCGRCRWGTGLKIQALREAYKKYGSDAIVEYIGIASDERERINRKRDGNKVKLDYPLIEWEMTESDCLAYCHQNDWFWMEEGIDLYDSGLSRVSCFCCQNHRISELKFIMEKMPNTWAKLKDLQDKVGVPYRGTKTIYDFEERFNLENAQISIFDM